MGEWVVVTLQDFKGLMPDLQETQMPPDALAVALDCDLFPFLQSRLQLVSFFSVPTGQIVRRVAFLDVVSKFLVLTEQKAYSYDGSTVTDITPSSGFTGSSWWQVAQQGNSLFFVNGIDYIGQWDGGSISYLVANGAPKGARFIASYFGHLVAADVLDSANNRQRHWVRFSDVLNPTVWNSGVATDIKLDTRAQITGLVVTKNTLVVFTQNEVWTMPYVGARAVGESPVIVQKQYEGVGCLASGSIAVTPDGQVFFLAEDGFYRYDVASAPELISPFMTRWLRDNLNRSRLAEVRSCVLPQRSVYVVALPVGTGFVVWAFNYRQGGWTQYQVSLDSAQTLFLPEGWTGVVGQGNNVLKWNGTTAQTWTARTPLSDLGYVGAKRVQWLEVVTNADGSIPITVQFQRANVPSSAQSLPSRTLYNQVAKNKIPATEATGQYLSLQIQTSAPIERLVLTVEQKRGRVA